MLHTACMEDFSFFPGNSPSDSDTGDWGETYGALVGPRLTMAMFARRHAFTVSAQDTHRSTLDGPGSHTGRRFVKVTLHPGEEPRASCEDRSCRCRDPRLQLGS